MNAPKLRFKEFNDEWCYQPLSKYVNRIITKNKSNESNLVLTISAQLGLIDQTKFFNRSVSSSNLTEYYLLKNGDFAYNKSYSNGYPWGAVKRLNKYNQGVVSPLYICFKPNNLINSNYLEQYFETNKWYQQISEVSVEGARNHGLLNIAVNDFFDTKHYIPSMEEQLKIANFLSLLDKKIELQSRKIEDLKLFKLYTENNLLNSNSSIYWKKIKLNDILIEGNKKPVKNTNDFKKITIKLNLNGLEFNESKREKSDRRPFYIREENEIIIGKQNYFNGSIAIVTKEFSGCICSNAIMSFKVKEGYNLKYIYLYLSQKKYMKEREFLANGTGQKELSEKEFLKFTIKVPEDSVVKNITNIIDKINKKINFEKNKLTKLIELKKGVMQNMFV